MNEVLSRRDRRRQAWFHSPISEGQRGELQNFLRGEDYGNGGHGSYFGGDNFYRRYEEITGKKKIDWIDGIQRHHMTPRDLNGPGYPWNALELTKVEHLKITNIVNIIKQLNGRALTNDGEEIKYLVRCVGQDEETMRDYLGWLDMGHHLRVFV